MKRKDCKHCEQVSDLERLSDPDAAWADYEDAECEDHPCLGQHSPDGVHRPSRPKQSDRSGEGTTTLVFMCSWCRQTGDAVIDDEWIAWS